MAVAFSGSRSEHRQCVTSGRLLSADLHNTVFPFSARTEKQACFCKTAKRRNEADGSPGLGVPLATADTANVAGISNSN